jgi:hypothetical protein
MHSSYSKQECEGYAQWLHQILVAGWPFLTLLLCGGIQLRKLILPFKCPIQSVKLSDFIVLTPYLTEELSKLRSFDKQ